MCGRRSSTHPYPPRWVPSWPRDRRSANLRLASDVIHASRRCDVVSIEEMHLIAQERGGKCLSDTYINNNVKLSWECAEGHQWEAIPGSVRRGSWCPECAGKTPLTIEEMHRLAQKRNGKCISHTYVNFRTKILWECAEGHQWESSPANVKRGSWCSQCRKK